MRITLGELRRIIREMAFADVSPTVPRDEDQEDSKELRTHRKFHASPRQVVSIDPILKNT